MYTKSIDDEIAFIKNLVCGKEVLCPKCENAHLERFHKRAKKSNMDYVCPACNERYQVIKMMDALEE